MLFEHGEIAFFTILKYWGLQILQFERWEKYYKINVGDAGAFVGLKNVDFSGF